MNDFTKDELENILTCVNAISYNNEASSLTLKSSQDKLQALIDNYCEHKDRDVNVDENGHLLVQCDHCGLILWHEKD